MESIQMLRLALQHPARWPSGPKHGKELPGMTQNPRVRVRLVSLQAAEYLCVSHWLFSVSCVHQTGMTITAPDQRRGFQ